MCAPLPYAVKMSVDSEYVTAGSAGTFTCDVGHRFPDGYRISTVYCDGHGWSNDPQNCLGIHGNLTFAHGLSG